jgi:predicted amidohydrolase
MTFKPKVLEVAALQFKSHHRYQENLDALLSYLDTHKEKELIVAPEVFLTTYDYEHMTTAAKFSANALKTLKKEVDNQIVIFTLILEDGDEFVNQAVVIHKHKVVHRQNKVKLFRMGDEDLYFRAGKKKRVQTFEIAGVHYALLICFELRFKELWAQIEGADIVCIPARWGKARKRHLEILSQALAVMNQCYVIVANSADDDMASSSTIISPTGEMKLDDSAEAVEGVVDFREIKKMRRYIVMR